MEEVRAGFWVRLAAALVDGIIMQVAGLIAGVALGIILVAAKANLPPVANSVAGFAIGLFMGCLYYTMMTAHGGQTLGKMLVKVRVVDMDGGQISLGVSFLRWLSYLLSYLPLSLGFLWVGFTSEKRGFHDYAAGTKVVHTDPKDKRTGLIIAIVLIFCFLLVFAVLGILAAIAIPHFAQMTRKAEEGATKANIGVVRSGLSIYYGDANGEYPDTLDVLSPKYVADFPRAKLTRYHEPSSAVEYVSARAATTDAGGWAYVNNKASPEHGEFFVNCTHTDTKGTAWNSY